MSGAPIRVVKHSLVIAGHRTSISLEEPFWTELKGFAAERDMSLAALVAEIDSARGGANLSSAIRVALLERLRQKAQ
ncbi:MAG: Arylsulfate sulfotransferase [Hyphomicrobiales bacterium]|nr:Arylsulfate sulfotransferase [Hyphomicrobiales bacterium]